MGKRRRLAIFILALLLACLWILPAQAHEALDRDRLCSAAFTLKYGDEPVGGGDLAVYRVAEAVHSDGDYSFRLTGDFAESGLSLEDIQSAEAASAFVRYVYRNRLEPLARQTISEEGQVTFTELPVGLYLVRQLRSAPGFRTLAPFLLSLPQDDGDAYVYDITAQPKTELKPAPSTPDPKPDPEPEPEPEPEPDPEPEPEPDPDHDDLGDDGLPLAGQLTWPIPLLTVAGLGLVAAGWFLATRKEADDEA